MLREKQTFDYGFACHDYGKTKLTSFVNYTERTLVVNVVFLVVIQYRLSAVQRCQVLQQVDFESLR